MVKITKVAKSPSAKYESADSPDSYRASLEAGENVSPNIDYWIIGDFLQPPEIGKSVVVDRRIRNGVKMLGIFRSSIVKEVTPTGFITNNSVYLVESVEDCN